MTARLATLALALAALAAGCGGTRTVTVARTVTRTQTVTAPAPTTASTTTAPTTTAPAPGAACAGADLSGTFAVVPGSAGAGNVSYRLRLVNGGSAPCFVSGLPEAQLLDASGALLPTHVSAAQPGQATPARIVLAPGSAAVADARFSPDVPGVGEQQTGRCEPTAATLRVAAPGGGSVDAPVRPPTPVCEHGALHFSLYAAG